MAPGIDKALLSLVQSDDDWRNKFDKIKEVIGLGTQTATTLVAEMPELGKVNRQQAAAPRIPLGSRLGLRGRGRAAGC